MQRKPGFAHMSVFGSHMVPANYLQSIRVMATRDAIEKYGWPYICRNGLDGESRRICGWRWESIYMLYHNTMTAAAAYHILCTRVDAFCYEFKPTCISKAHMGRCADTMSLLMRGSQAMDTSAAAGTDGGANIASVHSGRQLQ